MASKLLIFNEAAEQAPSENPAKDATKSFSRRQPSRLMEVAQDHAVPSDRELSVKVTQAIAMLQDSMDSANRAGLIIEPSFKSITGRFNEFGVSVDSYVCSVEMYRKLS